MLLLPILVGSLGAQVLTESFKNTTTTDPNWVLSGTGYTPVLTGDGVIDPAGDGWLRLTDTTNQTATNAYNNTAFNASGTTIYASFEYASWGGTGADGIGFFLFDGSTTFSVGAPGGSLGYANRNAEAGMAGGYIGIGLDEYGNFGSSAEGKTGGLSAGLVPDAISVRGDAASGYEYLGGSGTLANSIDTPGVGTRPTTVNSVQILLTATNQLTVTLKQGSIAAQTVLQLDLSTYTRPGTLKLGFTGGTGGVTNYHEVRNVQATTVEASLWDNQGDSTWGNASNWNPANVPGVGADILFDNTYVSTNQTVDTESDRTVRAINFDAGFDYTINNHTLIFDNGGVAGFSGIGTSNTNGSGDHTINSDLQATNDIFIRNNNTGALALNGDLDTGGNTITFDGTGDAASENGSITGSGDIIKNDSGTLTLTGSNTYTGTTEINGGTVIAANNNALGTTGSGTTVGASGTLALTNNITVAETLTNNGTLGNTSGTNTFSGVVSGTGAVDITGGQLTLSGNNTYSGTTDIASGSTVVANNNNSLGSTAGGTTVDSGGTLSLTNNITVGAEALTNNGTLANTSGTNSFGGDITGTGGVTLTEGQLTLSGTNTYAGATTIGDGTIALGGSGALGTSSDVSIASTGVLDLAGNSQAVGDLTAAEGATLDFGTSSGANTFVFDTYTPPASGIFVVNNWEEGSDQLASTMPSQNVSSVYLSGIGVAEQQVGLTALGGGYGDAYLLTPVVIAHKEWDGSVNKGWRNNNNWTTPIEPNSTQIALFDDLGQAQPLVNLNASYTIAGIEFGSLGTAAYDIYDKNNAGNTIRLAGAIPFIQQKNSKDQTIRIAEIILGDSTIADITGAGDLIISADITEDGGDTNSLVRDGSGTGKLVLSGDNTFSGGLFVTTGVVRAESDTALGTAAATVADTGTLEVANNGTITNNTITAGTGVGGNGAIRSTDGTNTLTGVISGTGSVQVDSDSLTLSGNNTYSGQTSVAGGTLIANNNNSLGTDAAGTNVETDGTLSLTNNITIASEALALNGTGELDNTSGTNTYSGLISGTGNITVTSGQLTLDSINTYTGDTTVASGTTLVLAADDALGGGGTTTVASGGTLALQTGIRDENQTLITIGGTGNGGVGAIQNIADVNTLSADVDLSGDTTVTANAGTLNFGLQSAGDSPYLSKSIDLGSHTLTIDSDSGATVAFRYDITGTGGITKTGEGDLLLNNGWNTYTGDTNINDGKLILSPYTYSASFPSNFGLTSDVIVGDNIGTANSAIFQMGDGVESDPAEYIRDTQNITVNSDGYWNLQGFKETIANLTINGGTIDAQESGGSLNERLDVTGVITAGTGALSATSTINGLLGMNNDTAKSIVVNTGATLDIEANLSNGGFLKTGTGILELSGGNSFTGVAQIDAGIVRVNNDNGLGAVGSGAVGTGVTVTSTDAQLRLEDVTIGAEALSLTGDGVGGGGALRSESGTNSWGGTITLTGNAEIETASGSTLAISGNISGGGNTLTVEAIGNTLFTGINSFGTLEKTGAGTLTVTNTNTYGTANITDGEFALGATDILSNTMDLNVTGDGNFNVGNFNETVRDINGNGTVTVNSGGNLVIDNLGNTGTGFKGTLDIDGTMTLNGGLISGGTGAGSTGEMILTSGNTLEIASDYTFGTVGTTGGSDQLGTLTLADNATLLISGNSVVNIGTLNIAGDSILDFTTGADSNTLNLGSLTFEAGASLTVNGWNSFGDLWTTQNFPGATLDIRDDDTAKITFNGFTNDQTIWLTSDFGSKEITVPEPSSYGALLMAFALAAWSLRRRPDPPRAGESTMTNGTPAIYGNGHGINDSFRAS